MLSEFSSKATDRFLAVSSSGLTCGELMEFGVETGLVLLLLSAMLVVLVKLIHTVR